jgi:hypothetical protein
MPGWLWEMQRRIDQHGPCSFHLDPCDFHFNPTGNSELDTQSDGGCKVRCEWKNVSRIQMGQLLLAVWLLVSWMCKCEDVVLMT